MLSLINSIHKNVDENNETLSNEAKPDLILVEVLL